MSILTVSVGPQHPGSGHFRLIIVIDGDIIVDTGFFNMSDSENNRVFRENRAYNARISPLVFNFNTTTLYVRPGEKAGEAVRVFVDPPNDYIQLKNTAITSKGKYSLSVKFKGIGDDSETYSISGHYPVNGEEKRYYRKIENTDLYFGHVFKSMLKQYGIICTGSEERGYS